MRWVNCPAYRRTSFDSAFELFGGDEAVETYKVPLKYQIYDIAAEYWHIPNVEEVLSAMSKRQLTYWLAYRSIRSKIEERRMEETKNKQN